MNKDSAPNAPGRQIQMNSNPMRLGHQKANSVPKNFSPTAVDANRNAPVPKKQRRLSSRELMQQAGIGDGKPKGPREVILPPTTNNHRRNNTTGHSLKKKIPEVLPQHPDIKLRISQTEKKKNYRRGSITERYRRASVFNEIIKEQQKKSSAGANMEDGNAGVQTRDRGKTMTDTIQNTQNYGINTQHRSRIMAFEKVAHRVGTDHDDFIINPYCVASMPEPIRKAFVIKVCGIVLTQMLLMVTIICIIKYSGLGAEIIKGYTLWSLLTCFIPLFFLAILLGVRKNHPWNLITFSLFTVSWAYSLGVACVWLDSRLFISVMGLSAMNTLGRFNKKLFFILFCCGSRIIVIKYCFHFF
jgi:hypothetical protein